MEKIEKEKDEHKAEVRDNDVQEVLGEIPRGIILGGLIMLCTILVLFGLFISFFKVPNTITSSVTLIADNPPIDIVAPQTGRLAQVKVAEGEKIAPNTLLAMYDSGVKAEDVMRMLNMLEEWKGEEFSPYVLNRIMYTRMELGELYTHYQRFLDSVIDDTSNLYEAYHTLKSQLEQWLNSYALVSPIHGTVAFTDMWKDNATVSQGEVLFKVVPLSAPCYFAKSSIGMQHIGEVFIGQQVVLHFEDLLGNEDGYLKGEVIYISSFPTEKEEYSIRMGINEQDHAKLSHISMAHGAIGSVEYVAKQKSVMQLLLRR